MTIGAEDPGPDPAVPPRFEPLRPATRGGRLLALIAGPLLWLVALLAVAFVVQETQALGYALLLQAGAFLVAFVALLVMRRSVLRDRE